MSLKPNYGNYSTTELGSMAPMDLLKIQVHRSNSIESRMDGLKRIALVASIITTNKTRDDLSSSSSSSSNHTNHTNNNLLSMQLLPWLKSEFLPVAAAAAMDNNHSNTSSLSSLDTDEDEVLLCLATQLGKLSPYLYNSIGISNANSINNNSGSSENDVEENLQSILQILEYLCSIEETVVRDEAVRSIRTLLTSYNANTSIGGTSCNGIVVISEKFVHGLVQMCQRLASSDWFPSKVCAAGVIPSVYAILLSCSRSSSTMDHNNVTNNTNNTNSIVTGTVSKVESKQATLRQLYTTLSSDENPLVRRSCAKHFTILITYYNNHMHAMNGMVLEDDVNSNSNNNTDNTITSIYKSLMKDESDTVRLLAVTSTPVMCKYLQSSFPDRYGTIYEQEVLQLIRACVTDASWRVRDSTGKVFGDIVKALLLNVSSVGSNSSSQQQQHQHVSYLCTLYSSLLNDAEAEVRASAVGCLGDVTGMACQNTSSTTITTTYAPIAQVLPRLADDNIMEVRRNLGREIMRVAPDLDHDFVLRTYRAILEQLLTDEYPEVQLAILTHLPNIAKLLPALPSLVSSILNMTNAANWRVRLNCALMLSSLCQYLGTDFYVDNLATPFYNFLLDSVAEVRVAVITASTNLSKVCGHAWCNQHVLSNLMEVYQDPGSDCYLTRITILRCAAALITDVSGVSGGNMNSGDGVEHKQLQQHASDHPALVEKVLSFLISALEDKVANVRLVAARALGEYITAEANHQGDHSGNIRVLDALNTLAAEDDDDDCKFYSQLALDTVA